MAQARRSRLHKRQKIHDRRSTDLPRNAEVAAIEVDDPLALEPGEKIVALNDEEYELSTANLVIADGAGPVAIAGIIGGRGSAISNTTTSIVLESANFSASSVRKTSIAIARINSISRAVGSARYASDFAVRITCSGYRVLKKSIASGLSTTRTLKPARSSAVRMGCELDVI